ncbi:MAG: hypothetical protein IT450_09195, partial [Phycisphaerales bacterium]|nr:hypothetical protein [Phycisphaerales bacterium]
IDASWYDMNTASNDGPAAVFRLVINVENVSGADVSGGLGSVYFSTSGPAQQGDIKVADMTFEPVHAYTHSSSLATTGSFYVNGQ